MLGAWCQIASLVFPVNIGCEVVTSLKDASCPPPVSVDPMENKNESFELSDEEAEEKKKKKKKKKNPPKKNSKKGKANKQTEKPQAAAQEAAAGGADNKDKAVAPVLPPNGPVAYQAKGFQNAMREFVKDKREAGMKYKDACEAWMRSDIRADMLSTLSIAEMKKRRFC